MEYGSLTITTSGPWARILAGYFYYKPFDKKIIAGRIINPKGKIFVIGGSLSEKNVKIRTIFYENDGTPREVHYEGSRISQTQPMEFRGTHWDYRREHHPCDITAHIHRGKLKDYDLANLDIEDIKTVVRHDWQPPYARPTI